MQVYLVGGAVRDSLLGLPVHDKDWVIVGATPEQLLEKGYSQVGADFPVFLHPTTRDEYALARTERKSAHGYAGFECYAAADVTLEEDLLRRDLTINAMAQDADGNIFDPYHGQQDLADKQLRHVSPAFIEDPLRVLRVARFNARYQPQGFSVAPETLLLMKKIGDQGELSHLVPERVWQETHRALLEKSPTTYFEVLRSCGALAIIFPELDALFGVPQPPKHHPEIDTGIHSLMCLAQACLLSNKGEVRFAALVHDLGKALSPKATWPKHHGHEKSGLRKVKKLCKRLKVPKEYLRLSLMTCEYHTHIHRVFELKASTLLKMFKALDVLRRPERFEDFLLACEADARGRTGFEETSYPQRDYAQRAAQLISKIDVKSIVAQGYEGADIGTQLAEQQLDILVDFCKSEKLAAKLKAEKQDE